MVFLQSDSLEVTLLRCYNTMPLRLGMFLEEAIKALMVDPRTAAPIAGRGRYAGSGWLGAAGSNRRSIDR